MASPLHWLSRVCLQSLHEVPSCYDDGMKFPDFRSNLQKDAEKQLQSMGRGIRVKVTSAVNNRMKAQETFRKRPNNKNYYKGL